MLSDFLEVDRERTDRLMTTRKGKLEYAFGLYLNIDGQRVIGKEEAEILEALEKYGSIAAAAKQLERSYRFTWNCLTRMTRSLHQPIVVTRRGGTRHARRKGGGATTLTPVARLLLKQFKETEQIMQLALSRNGGTSAASSRRVQRK